MGWRDKIFQFYLNRNKDKESAINIIDPPDDGNIEDAKQLSFPEEFPAGEVQNETNTGPEFSQFKMPRQAEYGQTLTDLTTEKHPVRTKQKLTEPGRWSDSYHNVNTNEDVDLKLGDVDDLETATQAPYTDNTGPLQSRYNDPSKKKYNIILHAQVDPNEGPNYLWLAVDLDGTILEPPPENKYQDEEGNHLFGKPLPGVKEALQKLIDDGIKVSIYSARQYFTSNEKEEVELEAAIMGVLDENGIPYSDVYIGKKPPAHNYVDDRAIPFDGNWETTLKTINKKLSKIANSSMTGYDLEKIYEYYYKIMKLEDKEREMGLNEESKIILKEMKSILAQLLKLAIGFMKEKVYKPWIKSAVDPSLTKDPQWSALVYDVSSVLNKLVAIGDMHQDMATFSTALNTVHSTGKMMDYLSHWYKIDKELLDRLTSGEGYVEKWDREIRKIADEDQEDELNKQADDPVKDQKNYKGIKIDIEWPKGSIRSYEGDDTYVTHMRCDYGYARGIKGTDEDNLDIYLGDGDSDTAYVIEQLRDDGTYDEDKVMLGFNNETEAADMYLQHMPAYMLGDIREVPIDKLINALYGEPEDRRGEEDLVPSEEQDEDSSGMVKLPDGSGFFTGVVGAKKEAQKQVIRKEETIKIIKEICPYCNEEILEKSLCYDGKNWYHRGPCVDKGPIEFPKTKEEKEAVDKFSKWLGIEKSGTSIFDPKINKKTKSDYVGPSTSQVSGIGGVAADSETKPNPSKDKESGVANPDWPIDDNINIDPDETRGARDIPRPPSTETMKYRNP